MDLAVWTGDNIPHNHWEQTVNQSLRNTVAISEYIQKHMPDLPVFPIHGNHEFTPTNNQDYNEESNVLFNVFQRME